VIDATFDMQKKPVYQLRIGFSV